MQLASGSTTVLRTDFWGTPIGSLRSHGSYRPLTVLTLWLNRQLDAKIRTAETELSNANERMALLRDLATESSR